MQKAIREGYGSRSDGVRVELIRTSKAFLSMVCKRLEVISHEDLDTLAAPHIVPFVSARVEQAKQCTTPTRSAQQDVYRQRDQDDVRASPKSRATTIFRLRSDCAVSLRTSCPKSQIMRYDMHTLKGRQMGRGLRHFRTEGAQLVPPPTEPDQYESEAYPTVGAAAEAEAAERRADLFDAD